jgi:predicted NUDIX family NTP pyrophosphohydrolase
VIRSAGILLYRLGDRPEVLIAHMGGPFWAKKDAGAWSIPKGEFGDDETPLDAARREFLEELGVAAPDVAYAELGTFAYSSGKRVTVFVGDGAGFSSPTEGFGEFEMEWPPRSGKRAIFPEVDRVAWLGLDEAREKLVAGQRPAIDALEARLSDV